MGELLFAWIPRLVTRTARFSLGRDDPVSFQIRHLPAARGGARARPARLAIGRSDLHDLRMAQSGAFRTIRRSYPRSRRASRTRSDARESGRLAGERFRSAEIWQRGRARADPRTRRSGNPGAWYLHRALAHWKTQPEATPFALAEYNAGASRAQRWAGGGGRAISEKEFRDNIDFPGTRKYVESILRRYRFYRERGRM